MLREIFGFSEKKGEEYFADCPICLVFNNIVFSDNYQRKKLFATHLIQEIACKLKVFEGKGRHLSKREEFLQIMSFFGT